MPLPYERPSTLYMRELRAVARSADALQGHLPKINLLPEGFPLEQVNVHCDALKRLPEGTAEGSIATLLTADAELNRIRQQFIPASPDEDEEGAAAPIVERGGDLDLRLNALLADIRSAIEHYKRESGEQIETDIEPKIAPPAEIASIAGQTIDDALRAEELVADATAKLDTVSVEGSPRVETVERLLTDADAQSKSARGALQSDEPQPGVLERLGRFMDKTAGALDKAGRTLEAGADIADVAIDVVQELRTQIYKSVTAAIRTVGGGMTRVAAIIRKARGGGISPQDPPFDLVELYRMILDGKAPPKSWTPHVKALRFDFDNWKRARSDFPKALDSLKDLANTVRDLAPLSGLTELQVLDLSGTQVSDITPLAGLVALQTLDLNGTKVADITSLASLLSIQTLNLNGTRVVNLNPLSGLTSLENLHLDSTQVIDISPLSGLKALRQLSLHHTQIEDIGPLSDINQLKILGLVNTRVSNILPLANLIRLQKLGLRGTLVTDITPLIRLTSLKEIGLVDTKITNFSPLTFLTDLLVLWVNDGADVSSLAHFSKLEIYFLMLDGAWKKMSAHEAAEYSRARRR